MAKNDALETHTLRSAGGSAQYMRKDSMMLVEGRWYISTPCRALLNGMPCCSDAKPEQVDAENGLIEEEVTWEQAKTPHHAGLIADRRHHKCSVAVDERDLAEVRKAEVAAAESLLKHQHFNRDRALAAVKSLEGSPQKTPQYVLALEKARAHLERHEQGLKHAEQRVRDIRKDNAA